MDLKESALFHEQAKSGQSRHPWELARLELLSYWLRTSALGPGAVLDIGSGDAFLLSELARIWPERLYYGVDSCYGSVDFLSPPEQVHLATSLDGVPPEESLAAILLMDVLEHVADPEALLHEVRERGLTRGSPLVVITVPACPLLFTEHDRYLGHYQRFTLPSLLGLLDRCDLVPISQGYLFTSLLLVRAWEWLAEKVAGYRPDFRGVSSWTASPWVTRAVLTALLWDAGCNRWLGRWTGWQLPGLTCYAICRPRPLGEGGRGEGAP